MLGADVRLPSGQARHSARGAALVIVLMTMMLLGVLGSVLWLTSGTETRIATNFRTGGQAFYAADAAAERALIDLAGAPDWTSVLSGTWLSTFTDGPSGPRRLADGREIDLVAIAESASCDRPSCSLADYQAVTASRPWGTNNPRWRLFGHGWLADVAAGSPADSSFYVVVLVADDGSETDGDPMSDAEPGSPGSGLISLRAEAYGPFQAFGAVQLTVSRDSVLSPIPQANVHVISWRLDR
jgi:hypothetical protein